MTERADRMLTRESIERRTVHTTFFKGAGVFKKGKVSELCRQNGSDDDIIIEADVEGSYLNDYHVKIHLDGQEKITSHSCECPAHSAYSGLCKHCVAVLLAYLQDKKENGKDMELPWNSSETAAKEKKLQELDKLLGGKNVKRGVDELLRRTAGIDGARQEKAPEPAKKFRTTPGLGELISEYSIQDTASYLPEASMGQVRLEPHIEFRGSYMQAEFKIGISRMYVLRISSKLSAGIENLETVSYGAQLTFLHCIGAFEPGSRKMAQFLVENAGGGGFYYRTPYGRYQSYSDDRYININKRNADDFMAALMGRPFWMTLSKEVSGLWEIEDKIPPWDVSITRADRKSVV